MPGDAPPDDNQAMLRILDAVVCKKPPQDTGDETCLCEDCLHRVRRLMHDVFVNGHDWQQVHTAQFVHDAQGTRTVSDTGNAPGWSQRHDATGRGQA